MGGSSEDKTVKCKCNGLVASGTYEVEDGILTLTSQFGVARANIGHLSPKRVAGRMLKNICTEATKTPDPSAAPSEDAQASA